MEHLWAPWRLAYAKRDVPVHGNIFDEISRSNADEKNFVLTRGKACFSLLNIFPYNTGHSLVLPCRVVPDLTDLGDDELLELMQTVRRLQQAMRIAFNPDGFNIGINIGEASGAGIAAHLHVHIIPRWGNDVNFMTATAQTRVHPTDLPSAYQKIREALKQLPVP